MNFRTDLAIERHEILEEEKVRGVVCTKKETENAKITRIEIEDEHGEKSIGKPIGKYITIEIPSLSKDGEVLDDRLTAIKDELMDLLPKEGLVLVVGLGNENITPDALGPKTINLMIATRHISKEIADSVGLGDLRTVAAISPGVLGQTGIETGEIIQGVIKSVKPVAVLTIDALASRKLSRLGCTIQISDAGVTPGSGIGNSRAQISRQTLGVPVVSVGVPTVVDAATLVYDLMGKDIDEEEIEEKLDHNKSQMIVTPKEVDLLIDRASRLLALAINSALQPTLTAEDILAMTS